MNSATQKRFNDQIRTLLPKLCVLNAGKCSLRTDEGRRNSLFKKQPYVFVMRPYSADCLDMEQACKKLVKMNYYIAQNATPNAGAPSPTRDKMATILAKDETFIGHGYCQICSLCMHSHFGISEIGHLNPNVLLEIGLMFAFAKPVIFTLDTRITTIKELPFDLNGLLLIPYQNYKDLEGGLKNKIKAVIEMLKIRKQL